jgi:hypothetical protein
MTTNVNPIRKKTNGLLIASRIFGSIVTGLFSLIMIPTMIDGITRESSYLPKENPWEGVLMTAVTILFIAGYIISWKKEGLGGAIMILAGLTVSLPLIILFGNYGSLIFAIPFIASGLLYFIYWMDMRKKPL